MLRSFFRFGAGGIAEGIRDPGRANQVGVLGTNLDASWPRKGGGGVGNGEDESGLDQGSEPSDLRRVMGYRCNTHRDEVAAKTRSPAKSQRAPTQLRPNGTMQVPLTPTAAGKLRASRDSGARPQPRRPLKAAFPQQPRNPVK